METVLYECDDITRDDMMNIYGSAENVRIFRAAVKERYREKKLTTYPKKRIVMMPKRGIIVQGFDPVIRELRVEEQAVVRYNVPFAAILVQKWGYGFYHFVNEMLPKILRIYEYNSKIPIITFYNDTFIKNILSYMGVTNPIIPYEGVGQYIVKNAILMTETASGNPTPGDIEIIRKYIPPSSPPVEQDTIVLIYRQEAQRSISNFEELYTGLKHRFPKEKFVVFGSMPFHDTVALFQGAKLIIGAHGAGLSNMLWAEKRTPVIEIFPATMANACYWHLAWIMGNPHYSLAAKSSGHPLLNMTVDLEELSGVIMKAFPTFV
jgi:capsular polysaccharide biosynthesis protein